MVQEGEDENKIVNVTRLNEFFRGYHITLTIFMEAGDDSPNAIMITNVHN